MLQTGRKHMQNIPVKGFLQLNNKETKYSVKKENQAKDLRGHVANRKIKVIKKHMKIYSVSSVFRERQTEIIMRYQCKHSNINKMKMIGR